MRPVVNSVGTADTKHAYLLLEQKQFAAAAKEAKELTVSHPNDPEAWKIAGFAELNLKKYDEAAKDLEKAVALQRSSRQEDPNTESALGQAYVLGRKKLAMPGLTMRLPRFVSGAAIIPGMMSANVWPAVGNAGAPVGVAIVKHSSGTPPGHGAPVVGIENANASVVLTGLRPAKRKKFWICNSVRGALMSSGCGK